MEKREGKKRGESREGERKEKEKEENSELQIEILPGIVRAKESWHSLLFFSVITTDLYFKLGTSILFPLNRITKICFRKTLKLAPSLSPHWIGHKEQQSISKFDGCSQCHLPLHICLTRSDIPNWLWFSASSPWNYFSFMYRSLCTFHIEMK